MMDSFEAANVHHQRRAVFCAGLCYLLFAGSLREGDKSPGCNPAARILTVEYL